MCNQKWVSWCGLTALFFLVACGHKNTVILVPDPDGKVGQITVANAAGSVDIDRANQATVIRNQQTTPDKPKLLAPAEVESMFGRVISNQPPQPKHFILHFQSNSVELLPVSQQQLQDTIAAIQASDPTRISVVGHSDTKGDEAYNLDLSMRRALSVKRLLIDSGVDETFLEVSSHGEENPLVKTADNVSNAKNRRVEVVVR